MKNLETYKIALINEINSYKGLLIEMGFDWPSNEINSNNEPTTHENIIDLEQFYIQIMGYIELHNFIAKNYPHTSGR